MDHIWDAGSPPYVRVDRGQLMRFLCPFCGAPTAMFSLGDDKTDNARIEMYCDSQDCDAREFVIVVTRDGTNETANRADVRALREVDREPGRDRMKAYTFKEFADADELSPEAVRGRRQSTDDLTLVLRSATVPDAEPSLDSDDD